jgi:hypothetical protein
LSGVEAGLGNALIWSAQARLRFGTGRHVCQSESGDLSDMSPQSKLGTAWSCRNLTLRFKPPTFSLVKGLLAILFSVALIVSQAASVNAPVDLGSRQQASTAKCCGHCGPCKSRACCLGNNSSGSKQPTPAVATHGASQNDFQLLASVSLPVWGQNSTESDLMPASFVVPSSVAAPLYQRNCSYLI